MDRAKRLVQAKKRSGERKAREEAFAKTPAANTILGEALAGRQSGSRAENAEAALTLFASDKMLIRAFAEFQLDPTNPHHWKLLAGYMADALFAKQGAGQKWTRAEERQLVSAVDGLVEADPRGRRGALHRALEDIQKTPRYRSIAFGTLKAKYHAIKRVGK